MLIKSIKANRAHAENPMFRFEPEQKKNTSVMQRKKIYYRTIVSKFLTSSAFDLCTLATRSRTHFCLRSRWTMLTDQRQDILSVLRHSLPHPTRLLYEVVHSGNFVVMGTSDNATDYLVGHENPYTQCLNSCGSEFGKCFLVSPMFDSLFQFVVL